MASLSKMMKDEIATIGETYKHSLHPMPTVPVLIKAQCFTLNQVGIFFVLK